MSTTLDRRKAKKKKAYAEFDEYISFQLQKTQTGIRSTDIFTAVCGAAVFVISYLLVFVVLDHWVVTGGFGNAMRAVLLVGLLVGTLAWIGGKVVWPCFRRVNSLYAAKALEEASPELKSTLLNYVDLRSAQREVAPAIIGSMEKRAAVTLSHVEVDDAIDRSTLLRLSYALLAAVVLFSVYSVVSPKKVWPSIVRIFAPSSEVSVSTQTAFLSVDPGDTQVLAREFLTVTTDLSGEVPEEVTLFFTTADQQFVGEAVPMREVEAGLKRYQCILKGDRGEGLLQGLTYRIAAGDASTPTYHVTVAQPPSATVNEVRYSFPDYMELPPDRAVGSNIDTWEGTKIEITATANMVVDSAKLQFSDEAEFPARCEEIRMEVGSDGTSLSASWQPIIRDDGTYPKFYRVQCRTKDGASDPTPAVHSIQIQADQKPDVSTLQPGGDMEVAANAVVPLLIHASDPDFRLSRVVLRMKNGARGLIDRAIYQGDDVEQRILHELKIADLNAKPGDVITWWVEAHDNRRVETSSRTLLDENRSSTPKLKFLIQAPVSEEEAEEQLERDKQRAEEKLDELDQRSGNDDQSVDDSDSGMPDREPDAARDEPSEANDQRSKNDEPEPEENSSDEKNSKGEESKDEGKGGNDSDSNSDGDDGKQRGDETGKSDGDNTGAGEEGSDSERPGTKSKPDGKKGESGTQKPVSNDGSQDDEILKELLKQNRDSKPDRSKDGDKKDAGPKSKGGDKKDAGEKNDGDANESSKDPPADEKSDSPDAEPGEKDSSSDSPSSKGNDTKDENEVGKPKGGSPPDKSGGNSSEEGMPGEEDKKSPKGSEDPKSPSNSNKGSDGDDPSKTGKPQDDPSADKPSDASGMPDSGMPDSEKPKPGEGSGDGDDPKASPSSEPSDDPSDAGEPGEPGKKKDNGDGSKSSEPGDTSKGGESGKSEGSNSPSQEGDTGESSPSKNGSDGKSPAENGSKSGADGESKDKPSGSGSSKSSSRDGGKPRDGSASDKPGQSSTDKPATGQGGGPKSKDNGKPGKGTGEEAGSKPGKESSESGGDQKSGDAKSGKQGSDDAPGKAGKPGEGNSDGGKPSEGSSGAGQSKKPGGNPGQSTGSKPSGSSDPGGEAVASPDDDANLDDAVQRPGSGANPSDPNLKDADKANLDDKLKASNMVLKRLKEELDRGDVDAELLKKLGWTEKDMQRFAERLERQLAQPKPDDPAAEARRRQFEEVLRNVDLESSGREQAGDFSNQKSTSNFSERRLPAPRSHRKAYEDYIKRLSQQRRGSAAPKSGK